MKKAVLFDFYGTLADIKTDEANPFLWQKLADWLAANMIQDISPEQLELE